MAMKGFYFSMDALLGLMIIGAASILVVTTSSVSKGVTGEQVEYDNFKQQAIDISYVMRSEDFNSINKTYRDQLIEDTGLERTETDSIARSVLVLHREDPDKAEELAENYLETFEHDSGLYIGSEDVVELEAETKASKSFAVSDSEGVEEFKVVVGE